MFFSKNLNLIEYNYEINNKKLLAQYFGQSTPELKVIRILIKVITAHKTSEYFMTTKKL